MSGRPVVSPDIESTYVLPKDQPPSPTVDEKAENKDKDGLTRTSIHSVSSDDKAHPFPSSTLEGAGAPELDAEGIPEYDWSSDEFKDIPDLVRAVVSFEDDPTLPAVTFRAVLLSSIFIAIGSFVSQLSYFRTTSAPFPVFFVILASKPLGHLLARILPAKRIPLGRWSFNLNPGPWSIKEHVVVGLAANAGSQGQWATYLPTNAALFYGVTMSPAIALFFGWGASLLGFAFAAMVRPILIDDPRFLFPLSLQQVTLYRSMHGTSDLHLQRSKSQMKGFYIITAVIFAWQWLPEYLFPFVASLAPLCWFASKNPTANFLGAGRGGVGLLNISLNWSNITSTVITLPYHVQVTVFAAFVLTTWILIPVAYFGDLWNAHLYPIMSNGVFTKNGSSYPFSELLYTSASGDQVLNETRFDEVGLAYSGAQYTWEIFMWYASYIAAFVWCGLELSPNIMAVIRARRKKEEVHNDRLSILQRAYKSLTLIEWGILTAIPILILLILVVVPGTGLYMPWWTYFIALGFGAAAMLPLSAIYAISGYGVKVGFFNELVYGYLIDVKGSSRHPLGQLAYRIISGNVWYDARTVLEDQKIGHYMHIAPREVIGIQIFANMLGLPINYGVMRWVLDTKFDVLTGITPDPTNVWTAQDFRSYNTAGIQYALVGPKRLFASPVFKPVAYGFVVGAAAPAIVWLLHKRFPKARFDLWNTSIFFTACATFHGYLSTGPWTAFLIGSVFNFYLYRYRHAWWNKWAYITGAALDTGFNLQLLVMFIALGSTGISMANWWGNNPDSVERCFAL